MEVIQFPKEPVFITQEDIFKKDRAMYTFVEKCKEIDELELDDGTTKIFLNMSSKNGSQELVSLLQYMKKTDIENPEILVKDKRILEIDEIVTEVKESEEWEGIEMNILEIGIVEGERRGREQGIQAVVEVCKSLEVSKKDTIEKIMEKFSLSKEVAEEFLQKYW